MKQLILFSFLSFTLMLFGQKEVEVKMSGMIFNAPSDTIMISQFYGNYFKDFHKIVLDKKGNFSFSGKLPSKDYYVLRVGNNNVQLVIQDKNDIKIFADGKKIKEHCNIVGSDQSKALTDFAIRMEQWNQKADSARMALVQDPSREAQINQYMQQEFSVWQSDFQQFVADNQQSPALIIALSAINPDQDFKSYENIIMQLNAGFGESPTVQSYYLNYLQLKKKMEDAQLLAPGKIAPDFEELLLDRKKTMKLSDLRGKVVLIDFWASWCGPCRRENPNVVKTYEKYKADGFTVMSVSLDTEKEKWAAAIKQDNLSWPNHVSDLAGWNAKVAKQYGVTGVPFTVLIDKDGKVIKTNLRGEALEQELKRIYGH